jgi:putative addiction module component (TIGR02574 family)
MMQNLSCESMSTEYQAVLSQAQHLSPDERVRLANALYDSVHEGDFHEQWLAETRRRIDAADRGEVQWIDAPEAMRRLREITRK